MIQLTNPMKTVLPHALAWYCACTLTATALFSQCQYSTSNLILPDTSYPAVSYSSGTSVFEATSTVTANALTVNGAASVTFQAGSQIFLQPGFTAIGGSGSPTFHAKIAPVSTYQLTVAQSPASGGSVGVSPCSMNGAYSAGTPISLIASPSGGYQFAGWSGGMTGMTNPQTVTMWGPLNVTANFTVANAPVLQLPPSGLAGFNYFPRGHAWTRMLYDWSSNDCGSSTFMQVGQSAWCTAQSEQNIVSQTALTDLQMLKQNGVNFVHLYLWDQDILSNPANPTPPSCYVPAPLNTVLPSPGFVSWYDPTYTPSISGPASSPGNPPGLPGNQWSALANFVSEANSNNMYVFLEFATTRATNQIRQIAPMVPNGLGGCGDAVESSLTPTQRSQIAAVGVSYAAWVNQFVDQVALYPNVLIWGLNYSIPGNFTDFWQSAYPAVLSHLNQKFPAGRPLLALDLDVGISSSNADVLGQLGPYQWNWQMAQLEAYGWNALGGQLNVPFPDIYAIQAWTASHSDYQTAINCIAGKPDSFMCPSPAQTCGNGLCPVPPSKMIVTEFGTGTSMEPVASGIGNGIPTFGDDQTPTTTAAGQAQYLENGLCMLHSLGIPGYAYFGLYDSATFWESGDAIGWSLAWDGYWGLMAESGSYKPSWTTMTTFNPAGCPGPGTAPTPVVALQTDSGYYSPGNPGTFWYTAADVTGLSTTQPSYPQAYYTPYSCSPNYNYASLGSSLVGSCAFSQFLATSSSTNMTLTGTNKGTDGQLSTSTASASFVLGSPVVNQITDYTTGQYCTVSNLTCNMAIAQTDILEVFGQGFNPFGGNSIQLVNQANSGDVTWFFTGEVHYPPSSVYFWEGGPTERNTTQINVGLDCTASPVGGWSMVVRESPSGTPSSPVSINIVHGSSCQ